MTTIRPEEWSLTAPYWEQARLGKVLLQRCASCNETWHPPQPTCPNCRSADWSWYPSVGRGIVHSYAVVRHAVHPAVEDRLPYTICLIRLDEGPLIVCNLIDSPDCRVGMEVEMGLGPSLAGFDLPQARQRPSFGE